MSSSLLPLARWRLKAPPGSLLRQWAQVGSSTLLGQALGVVSALAIRMLVSPAAMGIWQACRLVLSYSNYASLGVTKAAAREWAVATGSGRFASAQRAVNVAWSFALGAALAVSAGVLVLAWRKYSGGDPWAATWGLALLVVALSVPLQRWVTFRVGLLRATQQFHRTATLGVLEACWHLALGALGAWLGGAVGLCLAGAAGLACSAWFLHRTGAPRPKLTWNAATLGRLLRTGVPLVLGGTAFSLFRSLDKLMLLFYLPQGEFALGCYSAALLAQGQLFGLGNTLAGVLGPRLARRWGKSGSPAQVATAALRTTRALAVLLAGPAAAGVLLGPWLLGLLLPAYASGLVALPPLAAGALALVLALPAQHTLVALDRPRRLLAVVLAACGAVALGNHWVLRAGYALAGVGWITCTVNWAFLLALMSTAFASATGWRRLLQQWLHLAWIASPLGAALLIPVEDARLRLFGLFGVLLLWGGVLYLHRRQLRRVLLTRES